MRKLVSPLVDIPLHVRGRKGAASAAVAVQQEHKLHVNGRRKHLSRLAVEGGANISLVVREQGNDGKAFVLVILFNEEGCESPAHWTKAHGWRSSM